MACPVYELGIDKQNKNTCTKIDAGWGMRKLKMFLPFIMGMNIPC